MEKGARACDGRPVPGKRILRLPLRLSGSLSSGRDFVFLVAHSRACYCSYSPQAPPLPFATAHVVPCVVNWVRDGMGAFQNQYKSQRTSEPWPDDLGEKVWAFRGGIWRILQELLCILGARFCISRRKDPKWWGYGFSRVTERRCWVLLLNLMPNLITL